LIVGEQTNTCGVSTLALHRSCGERWAIAISYT
jgi:hypothetical protein